MSRYSRSRPVAGVKPVRAPKSIRTHVMQTGGQSDHNGTPICEACGFLASHKIHDLLVPEGSVEVADRILGEGGTP